MDNAQARKFLDEMWDRALKSGTDAPDDGVDRLVNSDLLSIRYAILTQLLGKIADESRSVLRLQLGDGEVPGAWDARSFCSNVIVPWVSENHDVLGKSPDPYVNNPLRRPRLDKGGRRRNEDEWQALTTFLKPLDSAGREELENALKRCLESVARRLAAQSFRYEIPVRVSLPQTLRVLETFLAKASGGLRPLVVTAALMAVLGRAFSIFARVSSQGINEADASTGAPGDVMCLDGDGNIVLAVEVKDHSLTLADIRGSTRKARASADPLRKLLFAAPDIQETENEKIQEAMADAWASGLNIDRIGILELANASLALLPEQWTPELLREIGKELDDRGVHAHRLAWHDLLSSIGEKD